MRTTLKPHISSAVLIPLVAVVLAGCASVLNEIAAEIGDLAGCEVEIPRLSLPLTHSGCPERSISFSQLNYYATVMDVSAFPEQFPITSEGLSGQPRTIAFVPMMEIASLEGRSLVERHFRPPVENELPLLVIKAVPNGIALIALESKSSARAKISCHLSIVDALEKSHVLFAKDYEATATGKWSDGKMVGRDCS